MEKELFLLLLEYEFFRLNKHRIIENYFPEEIRELLKTLYSSHERFEKDLSLEELKTLHFIKFPALSKTAKDNYEFIFKSLASVKSADKAVAEHILTTLAVQEKARKIADKAIEVMNGKTPSFNELLNLVNNIDFEKSSIDNYKIITHDVDELLTLCPASGKWRFNIPKVQEKITGLNPGNLVVIFARPEAGKTASWISFAAAPGGFIDQGAKVHVIANEEPGEASMLRAISSGTGIQKSELFVRQDEARAYVQDKFQNFKIVDGVGLTIENLHEYVQNYRPDILIVDQLDKLGIEGSFARTDEKLRAIYTAAREIAKRYQLVFIAISQASAGAEGKLFITMDLLENSRTGKAAEADLILAIGKRNSETGEEEAARSLYIPKNKISGWHGTIISMLDHKLSRYT